MKTDRATIAILILSLLMMSGLAESKGPAAFATLQHQLDLHCVDCHSGNDAESGVRLEDFGQLAPSAKGRLLNQVEEQVYLGQMPPSDAELLTTDEQNEFLALISAGFEGLGVPSMFREKLKAPAFGNYVSHTKLFNGEIKTPPFSPARLWRISPFVFDNVKSSYGGDARQLRQPFIVDDKQGIKEYAGLLLADSAVVDVLLTNAGNTADQLIQREPSLKRLAQSESRSDTNALNEAVRMLFQRVVNRTPKSDETERYVTLFEESARESNLAEALRVMLMAVLLHHESVYRIEIGLGQEEPDGRRMLSPTELAYAIAFALTDQRPDAELLAAAKNGVLVSREAVRSQVERILGDHAIEKPRILRFFQEFFGYAHAHKVFKDEKRSGGFAYYGENYPDMYERDADFFVMKILESDQRVFEQLLTSDRYYILNRQTFRNTVYDFYKKHQEAIDRDELTDEMTRDLLGRLDLKHWGELNKKYYLHNFNRGFNGSARAIRQIADEARKWKNTTDEEKLRHGMQPLYKKYPMVYDLEDDKQDFLLPQPYKRPNRAGMLTHPAWLIAHSLNDTTDPIRRGKWIRERLLAGTVPDLPITVDATIPEDHTKTLRERLSVTEQQECWRCHQKMNPLGYAFEIYDDFGRFRSKESLDKLPKENGNTRSSR